MTKGFMKTALIDLIIGKEEELLMKNSKLNIQEITIDSVKALFQSLFEQSGQNLNQYIDGKTITFSYDTSEEFKDNLYDFLDLTQEFIKQKENKKKLLAEFETLKELSNCDKFIGWLEGYLRERARPFEDAEFIRQMEMERFEKFSSYVFNNFVLYYNGEEQIDTMIASEAQMFRCSKIMCTFVDMIISRAYSKEYTFQRMNRMFGLDREKCEKWHNLLKGNEEQLWRIMTMQRINDIEERLDQLSGIIDRKVR